MQRANGRPRIKEKRMHVCTRDATHPPMALMTSGASSWVSKLLICRHKITHTGKPQRFTEWSPEVLQGRRGAGMCRDTRLHRQAGVRWTQLQGLCHSCQALHHQTAHLGAEEVAGHSDVQATQQGLATLLLACAFKR